jgi:hypothetical protein
LVSSLLNPSANLQLDGHFKRVAASTIMSIVYDYPTILSENDHVLEKIERYNERLAHAARMGSYFVDMFPWMKHIPKRSWLSLLSHCEYTDGRSTNPDLRNGSEKVYKHLQKTLKCSEAFSVVLNLILYALISTVITVPG